MAITGSIDLQQWDNYNGDINKTYIIYRVSRKMKGEGTYV